MQETIDGGHEPFPRKSFQRVLQGTQSPNTKMRYCQHWGQSPVLHHWTRASYVSPPNITFGTLYLQISRHHKCTSRKQHTAAKNLLLKKMIQKSPPSDPRVRKPKWGYLGRQMKRGPPIKPPGTQNQGNKQQKQTCNIWIALPPRLWAPAGEGGAICKWYCSYKLHDITNNWQGNTSNITPRVN